MWIPLSSMHILKILVLPVPWTWTIFPFIYIIFSSLHECLTVFRVKVFPHLVKFIPRYFILFDTIVNGIVFFNSLFESSLLIYRKETDFCMLYSATLLNYLLVLITFGGDFRVFLYLVSCHLQIVTGLLLPFQFGCPLFSLSDYCG